MRKIWNKIKEFFKKLWKWILALFGIAVVSASFVGAPPTAFETAQNCVKTKTVYECEQTLSVSDKAKLRSQEIAKLGAMQKASVSYHSFGYEIEIVEINSIEKGVEVFVKGWQNDSQLGFGDGTVEIERFLIYDPAILITDPLGNIDLSYVDPDGISHDWFAREDLEEAIKLEIASLFPKVSTDGSKIVKGKRGSTVSTFKPDASPETSTVDGYLGYVANDTWDNVHDAATGTTADDSGGSVMSARSQESPTGSPRYNIQRTVILFDTSSLGTDTIDSAYVDLYATTVADGENDAQAYVVLTPSSPASNTALVTGDFDQVGTTTSDATGEEQSNDTDISNITTSQLLSVGNDELNLNATGISSVNKSGITKFGVREGHDFEDSSLGGTDVDSSVFFRPIDGGTAAEDPRLVVTHSAAAGGVTPKSQIFWLIYKHEELKYA